MTFGWIIFKKSVLLEMFVFVDQTINRSQIVLMLFNIESTPMSYVLYYEFPLGADQFAWLLDRYWVEWNWRNLVVLTPNCDLRWPMNVTKITPQS